MVEADVAQGRPDTGGDPPPILVHGLRTMRGLDLLHPPVKELANGRTALVDLSALCVRGEAPQGPFRGGGIPNKGLGNLFRAPRGRIDTGESSQLPTARSGWALPHRACTIAISCAHSGHPTELGQITRT